MQSNKNSAWAVAALGVPGTGTLLGFAELGAGGCESHGNESCQLSAVSVQLDGLG